MPRCRKQLVQALEAAPLSVGNPVIGEVTESDGLCPCGDFRHIGGSPDRPAEDHVGCARRDARLPQVLPVAVLQLADCLDRGIVQRPHGIPAVRGSQAVIKVDQLIGSDRRSGCRSDAGLCAARGRKDAQRLPGAVPRKERLLFLGANGA